MLSRTAVRRTRATKPYIVPGVRVHACTRSYMCIYIHVYVYVYICMRARACMVHVHVHDVFVEERQRGIGVQRGGVGQGSVG